ncbi:MAG: zinc ribbon domain-containing protein [Candidatus Kariarchaeaceae archaeon]|jgi:hypothetical protein
MTSVEKYCEDCGALNESEAKFCKVCGLQFYAAKKEQPFVQPQQQQQPPDSGQFSSLGQFQQTETGFQPVMMHSPRQWYGGNLLQAIKAFFTTTSTSTGELVEDPKAPSPLPLVFLMALISGALAYLDGLKVTYTEVDVDEMYESTYMDSNIGTAAMTAGFTTFIFVIVAWWVLSWILGLLIKGGLPANSVVKYNASQGMRKIRAYLFVPSIIAESIQLFLLSGEEKRQMKVTMQDTIFGRAPVPEAVVGYSDAYLTASLILPLVASIIGAFFFYKSVKNGLNHLGNAPLIIAILWVVLPYLLS